MFVKKFTFSFSFVFIVALGFVAAGCGESKGGSTAAPPDNVPDLPEPFEKILVAPGGVQRLNVGDTVEYSMTANVGSGDFSVPGEDQDGNEADVSYSLSNPDVGSFDGEEFTAELAGVSDLVAEVTYEGKTYAPFRFADKIEVIEQGSDSSSDDPAATGDDVTDIELELSGDVDPGVKEKIDVSVTYGDGTNDSSTDRVFFQVVGGDRSKATVDADGNVFFREKNASVAIRAWGIGGPLDTGDSEEEARSVTFSNELTVESNDMDPPAGSLFIEMPACMTPGERFPYRVVDLNTGDDVTDDDALSVEVVSSKSGIAELVSNGDEYVEARDVGRFTLRVEYNGSSREFACRVTMGDPTLSEVDGEKFLDTHVRQGRSYLNEGGERVMPLLLALRYCGVKQSNGDIDIRSDNPAWGGSPYTLYNDPANAEELDDVFTDRFGNPWALYRLTYGDASGELEVDPFQYVGDHTDDKDDRDDWFYPHYKKRSVFWDEYNDEANDDFLIKIVRDSTVGGDVVQPRKES